MTDSVKLSAFFETRCKRSAAGAVVFTSVDDALCPVTPEGATGAPEAPVGHPPSVAQLLDEMSLLRGGIAYLCGNAAMVEACTKTLIEEGIASADVAPAKPHAPTVTT